MNTPLIIGTNGYVSAIDTVTGNELWRTKLREGAFGGSAGSDVSVMVDNKQVYAGCCGVIYSLDISNGKLIWFNELPGLGHRELSLSKSELSVQFVTRTVEKSS